MSSFSHMTVMLPPIPAANPRCFSSRGTVQRTASSRASLNARPPGGHSAAVLTGLHRGVAGAAA
jgi:hypothetical protein